MDRISEILVFVAEDDNGDEGIVTMHIEGATLPMVMSNVSSAALSYAMDQARKIARSSGKTIKLLRFAQRAELSRIEAL